VCTLHGGSNLQDDANVAIVTVDGLSKRYPGGTAPAVHDVSFTVADCSRQSARAIERHPHAVKTITAWVNANGLDAAIWAALGSNFAEKASEPFSVEAAIRYLETRNGKMLDDALTYIRRAPPEVQTQVREAVNIRWPEATEFR
jgi:hypothetical protein